MASTTISVILQTLAGLSYLAQIILVASVYFAWRQISIALSDLRVRNEREAKSLAIKEANVFASMVPLVGEIEIAFPKDLRSLTKRNLPKDPTVLKFRPVDFAEKQDSYRECMASLVKFLNEDQKNYEKIIELTNKIEAFALSFTTRLADEKSVYSSLSEPFCDTVESLYLFYVYSRRSGSKTSYQNTLDLYKLWSERRRRESLEESKNLHTRGVIAIEQELSKINPDSGIVPLGTNIT